MCAEFASCSKFWFIDWTKVQNTHMFLCENVFCFLLFTLDAVYIYYRINIYATPFG